MIPDDSLGVWTIRRLEDELRRRSQERPPIHLQQRLIASIPRAAVPSEVRVKPRPKLRIVITAMCALGLAAIVVQSVTRPDHRRLERDSLHAGFSNSHVVPHLEQRSANSFQETDPCHILPPLSFSL